MLYLAATSATTDELDVRFDAINPEVWPAFERIGLEFWRAGQKHYSAIGILHIVRYYSLVRMNDNSGFEINDHVSPCLARRFMIAHPECGKFFEVRASHFDRLYGDLKAAA